MRPHIFSRLFSLPATIFLLSGVKTTLLNKLVSSPCRSGRTVCPLIFNSSFPVAIFQTLMVRSRLLLTIFLSSGLIAACQTSQVCPLKIWTSWVFAASHTFTVWSEAPLTIFVPSGLNATLRTEQKLEVWAVSTKKCPLKTRNSLPLVASQSLTLPSNPPETIFLPSELNDRAKTQLFPLKESGPLAARRVPYLDGAAAASSDELRAVRATSRGEIMRLDTAERPDFLTAGHIPGLDQPIKASADNLLPIGSDGDARNFSLMPGECSSQFAAGSIPDFHQFIFAGGDNGFAVLADRHAGNSVRVPLEGTENLAARRLPDLERSIQTAADDGLAVRAKGQARDRGFVARESANELAGRRVPYFQRFVRTAAGNSLTVRTKGDTGNVTLMPARVCWFWLKRV